MGRILTPSSLFQIETIFENTLIPLEPSPLYESCSCENQRIFDDAPVIDPNRVHCGFLMPLKTLHFFLHLNPPAIFPLRRYGRLASGRNQSADEASP